MGKATIIEAQNSSTVYEEGKQSGILGKLKGIFADYKNGTRNADRLYTEELWDNRVFGSEDVMEALETKTLFGELDHPEGDRCETLAKNAAISITKLEKRPEEGVIYGEAEILDTPTGRIVKALADSGAKLGISSRGMGEEIFSEGKNIIDPETYDFITFDVVVTPANTKARVALTESKHLNKLTESLEKEIKECETVNQLNQIKKVIENTNINKKDNLVKIVETKIKDLTPKAKVSEKITETNKSLALKLIKEKYMNNKVELSETKKASEQLASENKKLIQQNKFLSESRTALKTKLKEQNTKNKDIEELQKQNNKLTTENKKLTSNNIIKENKNRKIENDYKIKVEELEKQIKVLESKNKKLQEGSDVLHEQNTKLATALQSSSKKETKLEEEKVQLEKQIKVLEAKQVQNRNKLVENKKLQDTKMRQLREQVKQLQEQNDRFAKLPFEPIQKVKAKMENFNTVDSYSEEDIDLYNVLTNK